MKGIIRLESKEKKKSKFGEWIRDIIIAFVLAALVLFIVRFNDYSFSAQLESRENDIYDTLYFVNEDEYIFVQHTVFEGVDYEGVRGHQSTYYFDGIKNGYLHWENEQGDTVKFTYLFNIISCKNKHYYRVLE